MHITYEVDLPDNPRAEFTTEEKALLRPIAETLAMLDGRDLWELRLADATSRCFACCEVI